MCTSPLINCSENSFKVLAPLRPYWFTSEGPTKNTSLMHTINARIMENHRYKEPTFFMIFQKSKRICMWIFHHFCDPTVNCLPLSSVWDSTHPPPNLSANTRWVPLLSGQWVPRPKRTWDSNPSHDSTWNGWPGKDVPTFGDFQNKGTLQHAKKRISRIISCWLSPSQWQYFT